ncbi:hypothetical protein WD019_13500 [Fictibacillus sp. Mic-4]|uniref:hypothetical protein n=1 Tax=Fictibacillus TaxID=1329200 RepID=UPI00047C1895|nr:hypothetical protein [Fictibacillus gelatini]
MLEVQREIVRAVMSRTPVADENGEDFFIGYDAESIPYLILPTAKGLLDDSEMYAISFSRDAENVYKYHLGNQIKAVHLNSFTMFHDHLDFFFGPNHAMLTRFLSEPVYQSYVKWSRFQQDQLIKDTLNRFNQAQDFQEKERYRDRLSLLLQED